MAEAQEQDRRRFPLGCGGHDRARTAEEATASLPRSPEPSETLSKQVQIAAADKERSRRWRQKSLLEAFSHCAVKKAGTETATPETSNPPVAMALLSPASPVPAAVGFDLDPQPHPLATDDPAGDRTDSDSSLSVEEEDSMELSAYERKRLKNLKENAEFFASLKLFETAAKLRKRTTRAHPNRIKRVKPAKAEVKTAVRRSMRLQRIDPLGVPLPEKQILAEPSTEEEHHLPPGPIAMIPASQDQAPESTEEFLSEWAKISQVKPKKTETSLPHLESYKAGLRRMVLREDAVEKVVQSRIYSLAVHPSESRTLVAAGDKEGRVGLWNLDCSLEERVHAFLLHSRPVSSLDFSPVNPAHLLSLSFDGTVRCGDVAQTVFDEVFRNEECALSSFDFLAGDASTLVVGMWDGRVAVVDRRTPGTSAELFADLDSVTRTVHVHPVSRQYFIAAGGRNVAVYDVRHLKKSGSQPVVSLMGHSKSVASAYFSPATGNRVVTTCADDTLRIFGTDRLASTAPVLATVRHNNNTGRWLTRFRAVWDPKRDDCIVVGSMSRPRQIEVFHSTGERLHCFSSEDYLGSVCSINAWHPTRYLLAGGNSSGRIHVFRN